ncbi:MAG: hypothetical protein P8R42_00205 [Candidatus Binatia bacterium]|nr:hypothetical protein [Candidatus Binatia bacterium]
MRTLLLTIGVFLGISFAATPSTIAENTPRGVRPGNPIELRGEVVEVGCYLRDGSRGEGHKACALRCLKNGGQLGIVEDGTGVLYPLAGSEPATDPSAAAREQIAEHVAVHGRVYERAGSRVLVVDDLERIDR